MATFTQINTGAPAANIPAANVRKENSEKLLQSN